jgi:release factor glutamine methyltransferase
MPPNLPDFTSFEVPLHRILAWGIQTLQAADIPTARLDAELLLGAILGYSRAQILSRNHTMVRRNHRGRYIALISRRAGGEPVAYILGRQEFYGRSFYVDGRVLIPRPETEELVDRCLNALEGNEGARVADIGTGSGAIAITLAAERPDLVIHATDVSRDALVVAQSNAKALGVMEQITFHNGFLLEPLAQEPPFDLIVANLPYVGTNEIPVMGKNVKEFEPHLALFAGEDGLDLFAPLFTQIKDYHLLKANGVLLLEIGYAQGNALRRLAEQHFPDAPLIAIHQDLAHLDRMVEIRP